jgi:hypothetical protein
MKFYEKEGKILWEKFFNNYCSEIKSIWEETPFTYAVPKETQLQASLYEYLKNLGAKVELEPVFFGKELTKTKKNKIEKKADLKVLEPAAIIELKRFYCLNEWSQGYTEVFGKDGTAVKDMEELNKLGRMSGALISEFNYNFALDCQKLFCLITYSEESVKELVASKLFEEIQDLKKRATNKRFILVYEFEQELKNIKRTFKSTAGHWMNENKKVYINFLVWHKK